MKEHKDQFLGAYIPAYLHKKFMAYKIKVQSKETTRKVSKRDTLCEILHKFLEDNK